MKRGLQKFFGVGKQGRPTLPHTRRQLVMTGVFCILFWLAIAVALILTDSVPAGQEALAFLNGGIVVVLPGLYFIGQGLLADRDPRKFDKEAQEKQRTKEREK